MLTIKEYIISERRKSFRFEIYFPMCLVGLIIVMVCLVIPLQAIVYYTNNNNALGVGILFGTIISYIILAIVFRYYMLNIWSRRITKQTIKSNLEAYESYKDCFKSNIEHDKELEKIYNEYKRKGELK